MIRAAKETDFDSVKNITQKTIWSVYPKYYPSGAVHFFSDHHSGDRIKADIDAEEEFLRWIDVDDPIKYYPEFFRTELLHPEDGVKHFVTDER